jgi:hypothetical protein
MPVRPGEAGIASAPTTVRSSYCSTCGELCLQAPDAPAPCTQEGVAVGYGYPGHALTIPPSPQPHGYSMYGEVALINRHDVCAATLTPSRRPKGTSSAHDSHSTGPRDNHNTESGRVCGCPGTRSAHATPSGPKVGGTAPVTRTRAPTRRRAARSHRHMGRWRYSSVLRQMRRVIATLPSTINRVP